MTEHPINAKGLEFALRGITGADKQQDFHILPQTEEGRNYTWFQLQRSSDGLTLFVSSDGGKDKIKVHVCKINGRDAMGSYSFPYDSEDALVGLTQAISMSVAKPMEQIAKDIVRRLLPDATKFQEVANKRLAHHQEYVNRHVVNRERVLAMATPAFPVKPYGQGVETLQVYTRHAGDCEIRVQGRSYKLTFDVPHAIGIKLLELYKQTIEAMVPDAK